MAQAKRKRERSMIERMEMPAGVIGLRATGKLTRDDYRQALEPALREAADSGDIRLVFVLTAFDGLARGAWIEDLKTGLGLGLGRRSAWKRMAMLTDTKWIRDATHMFAWAIPGDVMVGTPDQLEEAKRWAAA
jgi:stage II sporulation SpoAA-like protein